MTHPPHWKAGYRPDLSHPMAISKFSIWESDAAEAEPASECSDRATAWERTSYFMHNHHTNTITCSISNTFERVPRLHQISFHIAYLWVQFKSSKLIDFINYLQWSKLPSICATYLASISMARCNANKFLPALSVKAKSLRKNNNNGMLQKNCAIRLSRFQRNSEHTVGGSTRVFWAWKWIDFDQLWAWISRFLMTFWISR